MATLRYVIVIVDRKQQSMRSEIKMILYEMTVVPFLESNCESVLLNFSGR